MRLASAHDKTLVVQILSAAFLDNKSVNYILANGGNRQQRISALMGYAFETCLAFGRVYIADDDSACALVIFPELKKTTLAATLLDIKLIWNAVGILNIRKALHREAQIKATQPKVRMAYLWFIGVHPQHQGLGMGKKIMNEVIQEMQVENRPIYLETSTVPNVPWYQKIGFEVYAVLNLDYELFFMRRNFSSSNGKDGDARSTFQY